MCWRLTWVFVLAGDERLWRRRQRAQNAGDAAAAHCWLPPTLSRRCRLGGGGDERMAAAVPRRSGVAEPLRSAELAYPRDAVRLRHGRCRRLPADGDPELDQSAAGRRSAAGRTA